MKLWFALPLLVWLSATISTADQRLESLTLKAEVAREGLRKPLAELVEGYLAHLEKLQEDYSKAGDLENALLVRKLRETVKEDPSLKGASGTGDLPAAVSKAQTTYLRARASRQKKVDAAILNVDKKLHTSLVALRKTLTTEGNLDAASAVDGAITPVAERIVEAKLRQRLRSGARLTGRFHSYIDDTASFYLNGKKFHSHERYGNSVSPPVTIKLGDCLVFSARDIGNAKHFFSAFLTDDGEHVLSLNVDNTKVVPVDEGKRSFTPAEFEKIEHRPVDQGDYGSGGLEFPNESDWMWEHRGHALFVTFVREEMFSSVPAGE